MEFFSDNPARDFNNKIILDPCAGGDEDNTMSYPEAIRKWEHKQPPAIFTYDIRPDSRAANIQDFLTAEITCDFFDVIITNPPFNIALDVIKKSLDLIKDDGIVIMLLRLNFFGSQVRSSWFQKFMPVWCYIHSKRMKFSTGSGTDSIEYMHAVWIKNSYPKFTKMRII